jgi:hypothetical protein
MFYETYGGIKPSLKNFISVIQQNFRFIGLSAELVNSTCCNRSGWLELTRLPQACSLFRQITDG